MVGFRVNTSCIYPRVWVRWVTQQVRIAVSCELSVANRLELPHLRRLPLTVDAAGVDFESYLRDLIVGAASKIPADADDRVDMVTESVLADISVSIAEPDLQTMVAWWLAEHHTVRRRVDDERERDDDWDEHECLDPEALAADLVGSGLIAPAWTFNQLSELAAHNLRAGSTTSTVRRSRRSAVSPLQIAFPI